MLPLQEKKIFSMKARGEPLCPCVFSSKLPKVVVASGEKHSAFSSFGTIESTC